MLRCVSVTDDYNIDKKWCLVDPMYVHLAARSLFQEKSGPN